MNRQLGDVTEAMQMSKPKTFTLLGLVLVFMIGFTWAVYPSRSICG